MLGTESLYPTGIAIDASYVYFGDTGGHVYKLPLTGGATIQVGTSANGSGGVALSDSTVYWGYTPYIYSAPIGGIAGAQTVANFMSFGTTGNIATGVAADANNVYVTTMSSGTSGGLVVQAPNGGGSPIELASGLSYPAFPTTMQLDPPRNLAVGGGFVYWASPGAVDGSGTIMRAPIGGGGTVQTLATGQAYPWGLTVDANNVYWTNLGTNAKSFADGAVMKVPIAGGASPTALSSPILRANVVAVDATDVYFSNLPNLAIQKVPIAGGASPTVITHGPGTYQVVSMAVDASCVYWSDNKSIYKVAR